MTTVRAAVVASRIRLEERELLEELDRRGVPTRHIHPRDWSVVLGARGAEDVTLIREISFHRARYAARLIEAAGGTAVNGAAVIETCGDKVLTSLALSRAGLPVPETAVALTPEATLAACDRMGYPAVVKPVVGSWGRLVTLLPDHHTAATVTEHRAALPHPLQHIGYVQRYLAKPGRDIRVVVAGEESVAAMYRYGEGVRTNLAAGGRAEPCAVDGEIGKLAVAAAQAVGGGVLGVDLIEDGEGRLYVLEVNHAVEFRGVQEATGVGVARALVDHALRTVS